MVRFLAGLLSLTAMVMAARRDKAQIAVHSLDSSSVVPRPITDALRRARRAVNEQLDLKTTAEKEASAKKASLESTVQKKLSLMQEVENKTTHVEAHAKSTRETSVAVEKAITAHLAHGKDHEAALTKFQTLAQEAADLKAEVAAKMTSFMKEVERRKKELEDLRDKHNDKVKESDKAKLEANDLAEKLMAASKHKVGVEEEQIKAEKAMNDAEKELRELQAHLDGAVSAATKAEAEELEADSQLREAKGNHERPKRTRDLLEGLRTGVETFFKSIRTLEDSMMDSEGEGKAYDRIKKDANLKVLLENYNLMVARFVDIHTFDEDIYSQVKPAQPFIMKNSLAEIVYICDPLSHFGELPEDISKFKGSELDKHCGQGLWDAVDLTQSTFP